MNETILAQRGTVLRKNGPRQLTLSIDKKYLNDIFLINHTRFITANIHSSDLIINPHCCYMAINNGIQAVEVEYNIDISDHEIIHDPYKYENSEKVNLKEEYIKRKFNVPDGYIDTLPKWYSFKFTYSDYNLIFIKPEMAISIQKHQTRSETWEVLFGEPIIISGNRVYYYVKNETTIQHDEGTFHSIINPNKKPDKFVLIKEQWKGNFDEADIKRVFNPNNYQS
ncbi:MAG: hypothetical protein EU539_10605 [Promethearchaeota archaeon]|nr:MAG: hypothetical protein EU539_10605 [Candidatus Lokiarchaeota archaeon]